MGIVAALILILGTRSAIQLAVAGHWANAVVAELVVLLVSAVVGALAGGPQNAADEERAPGS
jgi:hypothetical protein